MEKVICQSCKKIPGEENNELVNICVLCMLNRMVKAAALCVNKISGMKQEEAEEKCTEIISGFLLDYAERQNGDD